MKKGLFTNKLFIHSTISVCLSLFSLYHTDRIVWISVAILVVLFVIQRYGTDKVGYSFSPIICIWFAFIGGIGIYNFFKFDPTVVKAVNPKYIIDYFRRNKKGAWISLGGIVLCTTGCNFLFSLYNIEKTSLNLCEL
jgi:KUP system potassium uptake protein